MTKFNLTTPVVLLVFNRPHTTEQVFKEIRNAKPPKLLIVADGPRTDRSEEVEKCAAVRAIVEQVDWDCQVLINYSDINLGCRKRVASGLDWVFDRVDEAIILEDDCVPHPTFFHFCQELLERYRTDERVMTISGNNFQYGRRRTKYSYYFSRYAHLWGWATWRRAWNSYDVDMKMWQEIRDGAWLFDILGSTRPEFQDGQYQINISRSIRTVQYWHDIFEHTYKGRIDTWDYQLLFASWLQNGLHVLPNINLVSNIGFGPEATHTKVISQCANLPITAMEDPLNHPTFVIRDSWADDYSQATHFG
ncbi:glycosyltransferase family A protein [Pelosinus baikalensis]|uniref:Glycosyltransferase family 2 protein n=1 Tax=Pelosinus baikalensis TaxID=2892015 RepID=A0ABS8HZY7_9FIRM|nr:glycosyltransferase family 2 protein [Pelosinus baikalensis]MCC5468074.1 glycosyltransferase family 2 protein [Pelosinus baikalensis]